MPAQSSPLESCLQAIAHVAPFAANTTKDEPSVAAGHRLLTDRGFGVRLPPPVETSSE